MLSQVKYVLSLGLSPNQKYRGDCPFCGGKNTFSAENSVGLILWNCFKSSCDAYGTLGVDIPKDEVENVVNLLTYQKTETAEEFDIPSHFISVSGNASAMALFRSYDLIDVLTTPHIHSTIKFDARTNRVVFLLRDVDDVRPVGAIGRSTNPREFPKWRFYGRNKLVPYVAYPKIASDIKSVGIIVEDCLSALKVSAIGAHGIAILGTTLHKEYASRIKDLPVDMLLIALDKDATKKSLDIQRELEYIHPTKIVMLGEADIKSLSTDVVKSLIRSVIQ